MVDFRSCGLLIIVFESGSSFRKQGEHGNQENRGRLVPYVSLFGKTHKTQKKICLKINKFSENNKINFFPSFQKLFFNKSFPKQLTNTSAINFSGKV